MTCGGMRGNSGLPGETDPPRGKPWLAGRSAGGIAFRAAQASMMTLSAFVLAALAKVSYASRDAVELEAMRDQELGVDLVRSHRLEQHRDGRGVDQPRGDGDIAIPQALQMQIDLLSVYADIGDDSAGATSCSQSSKVAGIPTASIAASTPRRRSASSRLDSLAVSAVDARGGAEALGDFEAVVVEIDHDDLGGREELCSKQRGEADGARRQRLPRRFPARPCR